MLLHPPIRDPQTPGEERFNLLTHGLGLVLSLLGAVFLIKEANPNGLLSTLTSTIYVSSLVTLFASSTFYHACGLGTLKAKARMLDHCAILFLIAGSYTPLMALSLGGWRGWSVLCAVWILAVVGVRHKFTSRDPFGVASVLLCLLMGWLAVLVWRPLTAALDPSALSWLVAGGIAYTAGVPFYAWRNLPYNHGVWHLFVLLGAACHYITIFKVV